MKRPQLALSAETNSCGAIWGVTDVRITYSFRMPSPETRHTNCISPQVMLHGWKNIAANAGAN